MGVIYHSKLGREEALLLLKSSKSVSLNVNWFAQDLSEVSVVERRVVDFDRFVLSQGKEMLVDQQEKAQLPQLLYELFVPLWCENT